MEEEHDSDDEDVGEVPEVDLPAVHARIEEAFVDVAQELQDSRDEHAADAELQEYFFMRIQGGAWTMAHKGVAADSATSYARAHAKTPFVSCLRGHNSAVSRLMCMAKEPL